jgi:hypothetical protein
VVVRVNVSHATRCTFKGQHFALGSLTLGRVVNCASGQASARMPVEGNPYGSAVTLHFVVTAIGASGQVARSATSVIQAAGAASSPPAASKPVAVTTFSLPGAVAGTAYSAQLAASGGTPPYVWALNSGVFPPGLTLSPTGTVTGTPTSPGASSFTVRVTDARDRSAIAALSINVVAAPPIPTETSTNWSGYVLTGGPFTQVTGTFNVPTLYSMSTDAYIGEWTGIDGWGNNSVLQAGVGQYNNASTHTFSTWAWIELYPAPPIRVPLSVAAGNQVTVTISEVSTGTWNMFLKNDTTGQTYSINEAYSGPAQTAEWIVEAPGDQTTTLSQYSPVTFTQLGVNPSQGSLARLVMVQNGATVSTPSALTMNGFTVTYGSTTPASP